ncbi:MAG: hypothetical protein OES09_09665 [Gammaproteobacteria bacterium]|nr:hypothetical protein [Gammaproteobacteria bacterium]
MVDDNAIARFADKYSGIEGFYFLNNQGELGFVDPDGPKLVKETFPQRKNPEFLTANPEFSNELKGFVRDLALLVDVYRSDADPTIELGYLLPAHDESRNWDSATLVLNDLVVTTMEEDLKHQYKKGLKDPFQVSADEQIIHREKSVQRGLDDLINHRDPFNIHRYFPALFSDQRKKTADDSPVETQITLRVINLMWRPSEHPESKTRRRETIFRTLRQNLIQRKAIDPEQRLENRFTVS